MSQKSRIGGVLAAVVIAIALTFSLAAPASAMHMRKARHLVIGGSIYNHKTHVLSSIKGTYVFKRQIKHKGRWHTRAVYGVVISAQHCYHLGTRHAHCKGRIIGGKLRAMNAPGRAVQSRTPNVPPRNYCFSVRICANPFYWLNGIAHGIHELQARIIQPCGDGALKGFGGGVVGNLVAKAMLSSGAISEATMVAKFSNPEAISFLSVSGCVAKVASTGTNDVMVFYDRLRGFGGKERAHVH